MSEPPELSAAPLVVSSPVTPDPVATVELPSAPADVVAEFVVAGVDEVPLSSVSPLAVGFVGSAPHAVIDTATAQLSKSVAHVGIPPVIHPSVPCPHAPQARPCASIAARPQAWCPHDQDTDSDLCRAPTTAARSPSGFPSLLTIAKSAAKLHPDSTARHNRIWT